MWRGVGDVIVGGPEPAPCPFWQAPRGVGTERRCVTDAASILAIPARVVDLEAFHADMGGGLVALVFSVAVWGALAWALLGNQGRR